MPAKEIKELRQAGKLDEAYKMALSELQAEPDNIWSKRNLSWVLYSQLDKLAIDLKAFILKIEEVKTLNLPESENMFFETISIVIAKAVRAICSTSPISINKLHILFDAIKDIPLKRDSKWFSVLYSAFHKGMKDSPRYIEFADWWNFKNFRPEDYKKEKMPNGKEVMALAEQAYIAYAKHLLPKQMQSGEIIFDRPKAETFLPILDNIVETHLDFQYPPYFKAKLLLALGDKDNMLSALLPFAKKKRNDFWVWDILSEAFTSEPEKVLACYCKALSCKSPEEMLVNLRQRMALIFIQKQLFNEAKTELELLVNARKANNWQIPNDVLNWQSLEWYKKAIVKKSNLDFYKQYIQAAESILFSDVPEENVIVEFVNSDKKILNFIASESKYGFFKYERFFPEIRIGDILKVRFQSGAKDGIFQVYTAIKTDDETFKNQFIKEVEGQVKMPVGKSFGFLNEVFIHPSIIEKKKLCNGTLLKGLAMKTFNSEKKQWGWKLV